MEKDEYDVDVLHRRVSLGFQTLVHTGSSFLALSLLGRTELRIGNLTSPFLTNFLWGKQSRSLGAS